MNNVGNKVSFICSVADLLRGPYEINFNRYFYEYTPPRPLDEIVTMLSEASR